VLQSLPVSLLVISLQLLVKPAFFLSIVPLPCMPRCPPMVLYVSLGWPGEELSTAVCRLSCPWGNAHGSTVPRRCMPVFDLHSNAEGSVIDCSDLCLRLYKAIDGLISPHDADLYCISGQIKLLCVSTYFNSNEQSSSFNNVSTDWQLCRFHFCCFSEKFNIL